MVVCYLAELQLPTDNALEIRDKGTSWCVWSGGGNVRILFAD